MHAHAYAYVHVHVVIVVVVAVGVVLVTLLQQPIGETCRRAEPCASKLEFARRALHIVRALTAAEFHGAHSLHRPFSACIAACIAASITSCITSCLHHALNPASCIMSTRAPEQAYAVGQHVETAVLLVPRLQGFGPGLPYALRTSASAAQTPAAACGAAASLCQSRPLCALQSTGALTTASPQRATRQPPHASTRRSRAARGLQPHPCNPATRSGTSLQPDWPPNSTPTLLGAAACL